MFNPKNENSKNTEEETSIEDRYIHTMRGDLASSGNISFSQKTTTQNIPPTPTINTSSQQNISTPSPQPQITQLDKTSPFSQSFSNPITSTPKTPITYDKLPPKKEQSISINDADYKQKASFEWKKFFLGISLILIIFALIGGGYFFWASRPPVSSETPISAPQQTSTEPVTITNPPLEKYSTNNPNFLSFDANNATYEEIERLFKNTAKEVEIMNPSAPIEFILTDKNNTPIAFHIFAALANISFPSTLLSSLDETFSIYFYPNNNTVYLGLQTSSKNKGVTVAEMKSAEPVLVKALKIILMQENFQIQNQPFKDSSYNSNIIRYNNLDEIKALSLDYTVTEKDLFIGTNKNTLRAIIDKNISQNTSTNQIEAIPDVSSDLIPTEMVPNNSISNTMDSN